MGLCSCCSAFYASWCCCFEKHMSGTKCMSLIPFVPLLSIVAVTVSGVCINFGVYDVANSLGVTISDNMELMAQLSVVAIILLDCVFSYSVTTNKMIIHNVHCCAENCGGYRIKDSRNCCDALFRVFCKMYNFIATSLIWSTMILTVILAIVVTWFSGCSLFVRALCQLSPVSIDSLLSELVLAQDNLQETPLSDFVYVANDVNSTNVCSEANKEKILSGSFMILIGAPIGLLAQIVMLVSYTSNMQESWRHMKDQRKEAERLNGDRMGPSAGTEMRGQGRDYPSFSCDGGGGGAQFPAHGLNRGASNGMVTEAI